MDKVSVFRHDRMDQEQDVAASWRRHRESRTISMLFADSLNTFLGAAERTPWLGKDRG
jgi:hypothetical protein